MGLDSELSPRVKITVGNNEFAELKEYSYETDILTISDSFSCRIANVNGENSHKIFPGDTFKVYMSDPSVNGEADILRLTGVVAEVTKNSTLQGGDDIVMAGGDLGWHLTTNCGPLWYNLRRAGTFKDLLNKVVDKSWGFKRLPDGTLDISSDAATARALSQGLKQQARQILVRGELPKDTILPRIQFEPGDMISDVLIRYARRIHALVNVTPQGQLQMFSPDYKQGSMYTFEYHADERREKNNVKQVTLRDSIQSVYSDVTCVGAYVFVTSDHMPTVENPNDGNFRKTYRNNVTYHLPFKRSLTFSDPEPISGDEGYKRASWKYQRGVFDGWNYQITVPGFSQGGIFYVPDTVCSVRDSVNDVDGLYYIQACKYTRDRMGGTQTRLTIRKKDLLAAF